MEALANAMVVIILQYINDIKGKRVNEESGIKIYTLLFIKQIINKDHIIQRIIFNILY